jgi:hypothetical protein
MIRLGQAVRTSSFYVHFKQRVSEVLNITATEDVGGHVADDNVWI